MMARRRFHLLFIVLFLFFMGWEWLKPFQVLTDTEDLWFFVFFLAIFCFSHLFQRPSWLPFVMTGLGFVGLFYAYYFRGMDWFSLDWLAAWGSELKASFPLLFTRDWLAMSPLSRTFFFLVLMWFFCDVIWHYVYFKRRVLWFIFLSVVYFSVLDTFTPYDGRLAVMITLASGLFLMVWLHFLRLEGRHIFRLGLQWLSGGLVLVMLATAVAYAAPKPGPAWPDPVSWLNHQGQASDGIAGLNKKVGYGTNDANLGGPFIQDNTVIMQVQTTKPAYWRGESKDYYTGKGWLNSLEEKGQDKLFAVGEEIPSDFPRLFDKTAIAVQQVKQQIQWTEEFQPVRLSRSYPIFHQGMAQVVKSASDAQMLVWGEDARGIFAVEGPVRKAEVYSVIPLIDEDMLRLSGQVYPEEIRRRYLQLPETLPTRVRQLTESIIRDMDNPYDKAKAVEQYLRSSEFVYDTRNVSVPAADQDFVDQFLFETKRGYCDYFSTAMVVMLRSVGIPARWVKGFTAGHLVKKTVQPAAGEAGAEEQTYYEGKVYSRNAHSWVEVYFEGVGWLPFEPTKGFVMPQMTQQENDSTVPDASEVSEQEAETPEAENVEQVGTGPVMDWPQWFSPSGAGGLDRRMVLAAIGLWVLVALILWRYRVHLWFWWQIHRMRRRGVSPEVYLRAYRRLLDAFQRKHRREPGETLREYLQRIQVKQDLEKELTRQALLYEAIRYGGEAAETREQSRLDDMFHSLYRSFLAIHSRKW